MPISIKDFWRLLVESRLVSAADCQKLYERSCAKFTAENDQPRAVAEWLVGKRVLTRYQAKVLLSGRAGPFVYGPYQLRDRLSGRLSGCFKAVHMPTGHPVLLWFFSGPVLQDPQAYDMAEIQIALACRTVHPCLSQTYQLLSLVKYKFVVLQDLVGATAEEALANRGQMRPAEACRVMRHAALGAGAMHAHGAAHGDIRPQNIWIDVQGNARLLQLPLSRLPHRPPSSPNDPMLSDVERSNIAEYAAPELAFAGHAPDALSDIYAIGCTLYQLLCGTPPFAGGDAPAKMQRHAGEAIKPLEPLGVPAQLAKVIAYAMAKDHRLRYQSAAQLADALAHFVDPAEAGLLPQPAATYAAFEAWRSTAGQTLMPHSAVAGPLAAVRVVSPQPSQTMSAARDKGGSRRSVVVATSATSPHAPFVPSGPHGSAVAAAALVAAPGSNHTQPANLVETNGFGELTFVTTTPEVTSATALIRQRRKRARNNALFAMGFVAALGIGAGVGYVVYDRRNGPDTASHSDSSDSETASGESKGNGGSSPDNQDSTTGGSRDTKNESTNAAAVTVIPDDGQTLWASPTAGAPISWAYMPARAEIAVALRPADLLHHPEAEKLIAALGPNGEIARSAAEESIGMKLDEIEQLIVAWTKGDDGWTATYVVHPTATTTLEMLTAKWQALQAKEQGAEKYFVSGQRVYFAPTAEEGKLFVVTSLQELPEILAAGREVAPLMRDMLKLVKTSDAQRTCTFLFSKDALLRDAQPLLAHAGLDHVAAWLMREDCKAAAISLHLDENCYLEARLVGNAQSTTASDLTKSVQDRMKRLAIDVEDYVSQIGLDPYGGKVLIRLGSMTRFVQQQLRFGAENEQVVINCYLPAVAAHNLALAADLAAVRPSGEATTSLPTAATPAIDSASSVTDKLKKKISFVQTGDTLEKALQTVSAEIDVPIEILGNDLVPEGITRNNRFDVEAKDKPAGDIIQAIILKANPDGKLVYVIKPKGVGGAETLFVTTRTAAARRGDSLPPEFAAPADAKKAKTAKKK